jgi:hypothetical protein
MTLGLQSYSVSYSTDSINYTALTNVQSIYLSVGVQAQLDQLRANTGTIEIRYPTGYASPIAQLVQGTYIKIMNNTNPAAAYLLWVGRISDISVQYGIPYASSVGNADYLTIAVEGSFASLGRMAGNDYAMAAGTLATQLTTAGTQTGLSIGWLGSSSQAGAAATISGTWADWLAKTALSANARMWNTKDNSLFDVTIVSPFYQYTTQNYFSDVRPQPEVTASYDQITFEGYADNYWTQISVDPDGLATQTVTLSGATVPYRTYVVNTNNATTGQALDFANYLLGNYSTPKLSISSVSCIAEAQTLDMLLDKFAGVTQSFARIPGVRTSVQFRGTTYQCLIEGVTMSATPAGARFTFYLSGADLNQYLILDDLFYGKLNSNKLGY